MTDADGDGWGDANAQSPVYAGQDCDDADSQSTALAYDADCDGAWRYEDCDDSDSNAMSNLLDPDCDGIP